MGRITGVWPHHSPRPSAFGTSSCPCSLPVRCLRWACPYASACVGWITLPVRAYFVVSGGLGGLIGTVGLHYVGAVSNKVAMPRLLGVDKGAFWLMRG